MKIVLASHNKKKLAEMSELVLSISPDFEVVSASDMGVGDVDETGTTFEENSLIKARAAAANDRWSVADDSGLAVDALDGAPGVYSARYSGGDDEDNIVLLLKNLENVDDEHRTARFVCALTAISPEGDVYVCRGECEGTILHEKHGSGGFGYDPIFYCPDFKKTFGELTSEEKHSVSHRGRAMRQFAEILENYVKKS